MSLPRYSEYKNSGVVWLGEVPKHWTVIPLKRITKLTTGMTPPTIDEDNYTEAETHHWIRPEDINEFGQFTIGTKFLSDKGWEQARQLAPKSILICCIGSIGKVGFTEITASTNQQITAAEFMEHPRYFYYLLCAAKSELEVASTGNVLRILNTERLGAIQFATPPQSEQQTIAAFLDRETGKIDALIAEQQRLVELLNEEIISLVLSSFCAPQTSELRMSEVSTIISRPVIQKADESYTRIGLFNRGRGLFHKGASEMDEMGESDFFWVEEGDLIISGQFAWEGAVALADIEDTGCVVSHRYPVIRGKAGVGLTEYLLGLLCTKHGDFLLNEHSRGAAGRNRPLNISSLMKEKIPVPSIEIQIKVARAVHARKALFKEIAKAIDLLQERRSALISAAVTGKIDVRDQA